MKLYSIFKKIIFEDRKQRILYWTLFFTISLTFVFFEIDSNSFLKNYNYKPIFTPSMFFLSVADYILFVITIICSILIIHLYNNTIRSNIEKIALLKVCGCNSMKLSCLYTFTFITSILRVLPLALIVGYVLTVLVHVVFSVALSINFEVLKISIRVFFDIVILILTLVIMAWISTVGFLYRNPLIELINNRKQFLMKDINTKIVSSGLYLFLFVITLVFTFMSSISGRVDLFIVVVTCFCLYQLRSLISNLFYKKNGLDKITILSKGYSLEFMSTYSLILALFQSTVIMLTALLTQYYEKIGDITLIILSFLICHTLFMFIINYNYAIYISSLKNDIKNCYLMGYTKENIYKSLKNVFKDVFICILTIPLCIQIFLLINGYVIGNINFMIILYIALLECSMFILSYNLFLFNVNKCI